jgi:hypothetical protein
VGISCMGLLGEIQDFLFLSQQSLSTQSVCK